MKVYSVYGYAHDRRDDGGITEYFAVIVAANEQEVREAIFSLWGQQKLEEDWIISEINTTKFGVYNPSEFH